MIGLGLPGLFHFRRELGFSRLPYQSRGPISNVIGQYERLGRDFKYVLLSMIHVNKN